MALQPASGLDGVIYTIMWDETTFSTIPNFSKLATESSVFCAHGAVTMISDRGQAVRTEHVVHAPSLLSKSDANAFWAALKRQSPCPIMHPKETATWIGLCPGSDHAKACIRLHNFLENSAPEHVLTIRGLCKQHATGLCVQPLCLLYDVICPAFCTVKLMHTWTFYNRFEASVLSVIARQMDWKPPDSDWRPLPADREHAETLLEQAYYARDLHQATVSAEERRKLMEADKVRRSRGKKLIRACPGDWRSRRIVHWSRGCCSNRQEGVHCVFDALKDGLGVWYGPLYSALPRPALLCSASFASLCWL